MKSENYQKVINLTILFMLIIFIFKSISILYYSSRNINYGFPFDSFGFDPFHRFTDYLIIWEQSRLENIYDLSAPIYKTLNNPAPYGFFQFLLLKIIPFGNIEITKYINFLIYLLLFIWINEKIYFTSLKIRNISNTILYLTFVTTNYPLFFLIDRGNLDIYAGVLISILIYRCALKSDNYKNSFNAILIACIIILKPSFGLYIFPLFCFFNWKNIILSVLLILFFYLAPIIFYGADYLYLFNGIIRARRELGLPNIFCHNFTCGIRTLGILPNVYFSMIFSSLLLPYLIYWWKKASTIKEENIKLYLYLFIATIGTLIINDPSPDYRLIFLIPFFFSYPKIINFCNHKNYERVFTICCILIFSFTNLYFKNLEFNYFTLFRYIGVIGFFQIMMNMAIKSNAQN